MTVGVLIPGRGTYEGGNAMKRQRRRYAPHSNALEIRLADEARELLKKVKQLSPGPEREALIVRARHNEAAARMTEWLMSPHGSRTPI